MGTPWNPYEQPVQQCPWAFPAVRLWCHDSTFLKALAAQAMEHADELNKHGPHMVNPMAGWMEINGWMDNYLMLVGPFFGGVWTIKWENYVL